MANSDKLCPVMGFQNMRRMLFYSQDAIVWQDQLDDGVKKGVGPQQADSFFLLWCRRRESNSQGVAPGGF